MSDWQNLVKLGVLLGFAVGLAFAALLLVERTIEGASKALRAALKGEFTTDVGALNLLGMVGFIVITIVTNLHEALAGLLVSEKTTSWDAKVLAPATVFAVIFIGSVICVAFVETRRKK